MGEQATPLRPSSRPRDGLTWASACAQEKERGKLDGWPPMTQGQILGTGKRKREAWAGSGVGLDRRKKKVFKRKLISIFKALKLGQIQMEF